MQREKFLQQHLRKDGARMQLPTSVGLMLLIRNILLAREPIYIFAASDRQAFRMCWSFALKPKGKFHDKAARAQRAEQRAAERAKAC